MSETLFRCVDCGWIGTVEDVEWGTWFPPGMTLLTSEPSKADCPNCRAEVESMSSKGSDGIILLTPGGDPVRVVLMDEHDERLTLSAHPEQGVCGYEGAETTITMLLEEPSR